MEIMSLCLCCLYELHFDIMILHSLPLFCLFQFQLFHLRFPLFAALFYSQQTLKKAHEPKQSNRVQKVARSKEIIAIVWPESSRQCEELFPTLIAFFCFGDRKQPEQTFPAHRNLRTNPDPPHTSKLKRPRTRKQFAVRAIHTFLQRWKRNPRIP